MAKSRKSWTPEKMDSAVKMIINKECGFKLAARLHRVPVTTLKRYVNQIRAENFPVENTMDVVNVALGRKPALGIGLENELVKYCLEMDATYYGLRRRDIKRMAFQLALRNNLRHPFSVSSASAGKKWLRNFLRRHPELSFRKPQSISIARVQAFTKENISRFFDVLKPELQKIKFKADRIFNVDESGITVVQHAPEDVLTVKGKREVQKLTSAKRGGLITVVLCMSAAGQFVPPMVIFPRKTRKDALGDGLPGGSIPAYSSSGWITGPLFTKWFVHFLEVTNSSKEKPSVLILDGHYSHTRNVDLVTLAKDHGVSLVCLPPHTSNKTQPLDVSFMKPLKSYYSTAIETWLAGHEGRIITHAQVAPLFSQAYKLAATIPVAEHGFTKTGIFPFQPGVFKPEDFKIGKDAISKKNNPPASSSPSTSDTSSSTPSTPSSTPSTPSSTDSTVIVAVTPVSQPQPLTDSNSQTHVSPEDIRAVPIIQDAAPSNRRGQAMVFSTSPYKNSLEDAKKRQEKKEEKKAANQGKEKTVKKAKTDEEKNKPTARKATVSKKKAASKKPVSSHEDKIVPSTSKLTETPKGQKKNTERPKRKVSKRKISFSESESSESSADEEVPYASSTDSDDGDDGDDECQFCGQPFKNDKRGEKWIMCNKCHVWCHEDCDAAIEDCSNKKKYICSTCLNS